MTSGPSYNNSNQFQAYSIKYQNINHRLQRLKHSQNQSGSVRSSSLGNVQPKTLTKSFSNTRVTMNNNLLLTADESSLDIGNKYAGRVTKNTGIKKYNQRQIRQILNTKKYSSQKQYVEQGIYTQQKIGKLVEKVSEQRQKSQYLNQQNHIDTNSKERGFKLIPGKIYTRQELQRYYF